MVILAAAAAMPTGSKPTIKETVNATAIQARDSRFKEIPPS
jgi:hypothetical protein